jgi:hypothetical protein
MDSSEVDEMIKMSVRSKSEGKTLEKRNKSLLSRYLRWRNVQRRGCLLSELKGE